MQDIRIFSNNRLFYSNSHRIFYVERGENMFTKKDRQIANQKAMIENRDKLIKDLQEQKDYYKEMSIQQRAENDFLRDILTRVESLVTQNTYDNEKVILRKVKEVIQSANENNF